MSDPSIWPEVLKAVGIVLGMAAFTFFTRKGQKRNDQLTTHGATLAVNAANEASERITKDLTRELRRSRISIKRIAKRHDDHVEQDDRRFDTLEKQVASVLEGQRQASQTTTSLVSSVARIEGRLMGILKDEEKKT